MSEKEIFAVDTNPDHYGMRYGYNTGCRLRHVFIFLFLIDHLTTLLEFVHFSSITLKQTEYRQCYFIEKPYYRRRRNFEEVLSVCDFFRVEKCNMN